MLFRKKQPKACEYCIHGTKLNENEVLCMKKGIKKIDASCGNFIYDPCKRIPSKPKASNFSNYDDTDFTL